MPDYHKLKKNHNFTNIFQKICSIIYDFLITIKYFLGIIYMTDYSLIEINAIFCQKIRKSSTI